MVVGEITQKTDLLIIGAGPGGYAAAFRAADLGLDVTIVDERDNIGGVCLYEGCIPSKTLLYLAELIHDAARVEKMGVQFGPPQLDLQALRSWKESVVNKLGRGLAGLSEKRDVQWLQARAFFEGPNTARLIGADVAHIKFRHAIVATGSVPQIYPGHEVTAAGRVMTSTEALDLADIPERLLIVGGGYIALEMGQVYAALGSRVSMVVRSEFLRGLDRDLVKPLARRMEDLCEEIHLGTVIDSLAEHKDGVDVQLKNDKGEIRAERYDRVLVAMGRVPSAQELGLEKTGVRLDEKGFIIVDEKQQTDEPSIFAIGDVVPGPMLAHRAMRQGKVAAEVIAGQPSAYDVRAIPAVVYTDPQIAWCGLTEQEAQKQGAAVQVVRFPWGASGRATTMGISDGLTKLVLEPESGRIRGAGIVGRDAEALIAECVLAIEMGALAEDLALSIHPHPSLTETEAEAAEIYLGSSTHFISK
ncbi:MAG: dihydrolipoyl dehydrogenase [Thermodesulfobacteriota bacterium]